MTEPTKIHPSGLNIVENPDGTYSFEWDPKDERWSWMNDLTDDEIKVIIEEAIRYEASKPIDVETIEEVYDGSEDV
jgi:hypothetical protein|tara:strand:+ start:1167 stop:1394 length:228 start_codon:yes stop_codon:yes gene_type:complete